MHPPPNLPPTHGRSPGPPGWRGAEVAVQRLHRRLVQRPASSARASEASSVPCGFLRCPVDFHGAKRASLFAFCLVADFQGAKRAFFVGLGGGSPNKPLLSLDSFPSRGRKGGKPYTLRCPVAMGRKGHPFFCWLSFNGNPSPNKMEKKGHHWATGFPYVSLWGK